MNNNRRADGIDPGARSRARRRALQALYAWQVSGNRMIHVIEEFRHEQDMEIADLDYFEGLLRGVDEHLAELDAGMKPYLDREVAEVEDPLRDRPRGSRFVRHARDGVSPYRSTGRRGHPSGRCGERPLRTLGR